MEKFQAIARASSCLKKPFLIMKLVIVLCFFCTIHAWAGARGQTITLAMDNAEISRVLDNIEKQGSFRFIYNSRLRDLRKRVDVSFVEAGINEVLNSLFSQTQLTYKILDNNLVAIRSVDPGEADIQVTGKVTNDAGASLAGVSITVKGSSRGTTTDNDGNYSLSVPDNSTLIFSYVGYTTQEIAVNNQNVVNVTMVSSAKLIDQVIVVGYGTQRKLDVTGAVANVKGDDIVKQPTTNAISALQGKVAGVQITNNGAPGASPEIRIRGLGTVYGNPNPLYVVDGVWFDDISFLNPGDVESISVLKDASAQSIYGIRAANGVVLISTKKGRRGEPSVNYNGYVGYQTVTNQIEMANANQYATLVNELSAANGGGQVLNPDDFGKGTDWYHQILRNAFITNHQVSLSGGSEKTTYSFSLGYLKQDGLVETNSYTRYTARLQNEFEVFKNLKIGYTATGAASHSDDIPDGIFRELYTAAPVVPVYYADGSYGDPSDYDLGDGANYNPQVTLDYYDQKSKNYLITGNVYASLKFARFFTFKTSWGGEYGDNEFRNYLPVYSATLKQRNTTSRLTKYMGDTRNWIVENTLTFDRKFDDHSLRVLVGQSAQEYKTYALTASAQNVPNNSEGDLYLRLGNTDGRNVTDEGDLARVSSYFGRINYSFRNRYLINASLRADGSSKFFGDNRWGYFPSVGVGWVISDESFMDRQTFFNNLKLRASWGKIGNSSVPSNISVLRVAQDPYLTAIFNDQLYTGASINSVVPPTTYWEKGVGTDIGLEATVLDNRLYLELDWYNRKTENAIFDVPILRSVGTSSGTIIANQADFQNRGFEIAASWKDDINSNWHYTIGANLGINNNKVLSVTTGGNAILSGGGAATGGQLSTRTVVGQPIGQFFGYRVTGIFQNQAEVDASAQKTAKPGDFIFEDISGPAGKPDGIIDGLDRVPIGNPNPKYTYGINTTWTFKQFDLILDFQGVAGVEVYNALLGLRYGTENYSKDFYDNRWHGDGTSNTYPSANIGGGDNYRPSSFYVESGSYFRVRNAQIGYTLPSDLTDRWKINKLRVYINAQNPLNFFSYRGLSPEIGGTPTNAGIDTNVYPLYATYNFGVNLTF